MSLERASQQTLKNLRAAKEGLSKADNVCAEELKKIRTSLTENLNKVCKSINANVLSHIIVEDIDKITTSLETMKNNIADKIDNLTELTQSHSTNEDFLKDFIGEVKKQFSEFQKKYLHETSAIKEYEKLSSKFCSGAENSFAPDVNTWIENRLYIEKVKNLLNSIADIKKGYDSNTDSKTKKHKNNITNLAADAINLASNITNLHCRKEQSAIRSKNCKDVGKNTYKNIVNLLTVEYENLDNKYKTKNPKQQVRTFFNKEIRNLKEHLNDKDNQAKDHYARMLGLTIKNIPDINSFYPNRAPDAIADTRYLQIPKGNPIYAAFETKEPAPTLKKQMKLD